MTTTMGSLATTTTAPRCLRVTMLSLAQMMTARVTWAWMMTTAARGVGAEGKLPPLLPSSRAG